MQEAPAVDGPGRAWSLRREWSRAFTIMLVLLLLASIATFAGVRQLVGHFSHSAGQLEREATIVAVLNADINDHEDRGQQLLAGLPSDLRTFMRQQNEISREFRTANATFPSGTETTDVLGRAARSWQAALTRVGLWGPQVRAPDRADPELQRLLAARNEEIGAMLDELQKPSLDAIGVRLANEAVLERLLMVVLACLFGLAVAVTVYFRRRMTTDLLRPVASMHEGVLKLQAGEYDHRIEVTRHDELGELAEAFNEMAGALSDSHKALTLRATHDSLTGLPNRVSLLERLAASFGPGSDRRVRQESVLFIDIDDFKDVNDSVGHEGGDALLVQLAARLNVCIRPHDLVARLGGDEFAVVVVEGDGNSTAVEVSERILRAMHEPFTVGGTRLLVSVSIGVAQRHPDTADASELLRRADFAMYMAKGGGKGCYQIFDARKHANMVVRSAVNVTLAAG
jgi:diguanylate cyclase (GGDEF)-like protein